MFHLNVLWCNFSLPFGWPSWGNTCIKCTQDQHVYIRGSEISCVENIQINIWKWTALFLIILLTSAFQTILLTQDSIDCILNADSFFFENHHHWSCASKWKITTWQEGHFFPLQCKLQLDLLITIFKPPLMPFSVIWSQTLQGFCIGIYPASLAALQFHCNQVLPKELKEGYMDDHFQDKMVSKTR